MYSFISNIQKLPFRTFSPLILTLTLSLTSPSTCDSFNPSPASVNNTSNSTSCILPFEGFGIFLGSVSSFSQSPPGTPKTVFERVYSDLGIRYFRTSYESEFSLSNNSYDISCKSPQTCMWNEVMEVISQYRDSISLFASIWSPPHYMKNIVFDSLEPEYENAYYFFIKNITSLIKSKFNLTIERVSPVNEPENILALWEHTNMSPYQLCRLVSSKSDPLISLCPENSYYWVSELYFNYTDEATGVNCSAACELFATHAYTLNINIFSPYHLLAYYDPGRYPRRTQKPIWMTEVSSTFGASDSYQMEEGLDFATNIINFVAHTCVQRYYFWNAYTLGSSGESLIWGYANSSSSKSSSSSSSSSSFSFALPKKYFIFKHFTRSSFGGSKIVSTCSVAVSKEEEDDDLPAHGKERKDREVISCVQFGKTNVVLVNRGLSQFRLSGFRCKSPLCCTTREFDWSCSSTSPRKVLPKKAVCSCEIEESEEEEDTLFVRANSTILSNEIPQPTFHQEDEDDD